MPTAVEKHAPIVLLDRRELLLPDAAADFVDRSRLRFVAHRQPLTVAESVGAARLGERSEAPYAFAYPSEGTADAREISSIEHTRPFDDRPEDLRALPQGDGFALELRDETDATGSPSESRDASVYSGAPVYFDYRKGQLISYWFFYAGSALPAAAALQLALVLDRDEGFGVAEYRLDFDRSELRLGDRRELEAREALRQAHPQLFALAEHAAEYPVSERTEFVEVEGLRFPGHVARKFWNYLKTWLTAIGRETYLCHQGDWERVTVVLDPADELGPPKRVIFDAHGKPGGVPWTECEKEGDRLLVYSARGSHASLPHAGMNGGDYGDPEGIRWETWRRLRAVHEEEWYGFGGAWGRVGDVEDLTGPLGPCRWKGPPSLGPDDASAAAVPPEEFYRPQPSRGSRRPGSGDQ